MKKIKSQQAINFRIEGHLKVIEYKTKTDYLSKSPNKILLNTRNAIHKDNCSVLLANAVTNRTLGHISYMYFGDGGATVDAHGNVIFKSPNVVGPNQNLYNSTYFQLVDDIQGAQSGNYMSMRHINSSLVSDMDIRCLITEIEPFGQLLSNSESGINISNQFYFNEIGLKTADNTLLTHVIFSPILKEATMLLEVVYTLRLAADYITNFVPSSNIVNDIVDLIGVQSTSHVGTITVTHS